MLDRRSFTFGTLVALISQTAAAGSNPPQQQAATHGPSLVPVYTVRRKGGELEIDVTLRNAGTDPVDVLVAIGSRPGPRLTATLADGATLDEIVEVGRRDLMSRIGPIPRYVPLAAGESVPLGTYRFTWLANRPDSAIDVTAEIQTGEAAVQLPVQRLQTTNIRS